ncbi:hypothetical protein EUTSA_v10015551mg, partial [Eutrema salsugineum]
LTESIQKPKQKMDMLTRALKNSNYNDDTLLQECGVRIGSEFPQVEGRVLPTPNLKVGNGEDLLPRDGSWNFNNKVKGIDMVPPLGVFEEGHRFKDAPGSVRVEKMFEDMKPKFRDQDWGKPQFLLCILSKWKNSDVYVLGKKKTLCEDGILNQYFYFFELNVLLKINAKVIISLDSITAFTGILLAIEQSRGIPAVRTVPSIIIGMDVSHGSPGQSDVQSISAVVSSREWPLISKYRACVRTQSPKVEMIDNLYNRASDTDDEGIMRELLKDFESCSGRKPDHIIIFRDGVSESQCNQVLNIELDQMMQACKFKDENWDPKFTVIIA